MLHVSLLFGGITHCTIQNFPKSTSFHGLKVCVFCFVYMYHVIEITYKYLWIDHDLEKLADVPLVIDGDQLPLFMVSETKAYNQLCKKKSKNVKADNHSSEEEEDKESYALLAQSHSHSSHASVSGTSSFSKCPTAPLPSCADATINPHPAKQRWTNDDEDMVYNVWSDHSSHAPNTSGHVTNCSTGAWSSAIISLHHTHPHS